MNAAIDAWEPRVNAFTELLADATGGAFEVAVKDTIWMKGLRATPRFTMQMTAFPVGTLPPGAIDGVPVDPFFDDWCNFCLPANLTGVPATSVPRGYHDDGLPIGLHVMGPRGADEWTLAVAAAWEALSAPHRRRPTPSSAPRSPRRRRRPPHSGPGGRRGRADRRRL
jgi:hypothetical protein